MPRPARSAPDVVHIGSASRDIAPDDPRGWRLGGGVSYASLTTARLGLRTAALIGVDATAVDAVELDTLRAAGVDIQLAHLAEGPVFQNIETQERRVQTVLRPGVPLAPRPLPDAWLEARGWSLVPVADEIDEVWTERIPADAIVAVGWQGMLRSLVAGQRVAPRRPQPNSLLRRADLIGVSEGDLVPGTQPLDLVRCLRPGARLLITRGDQGGTVIDVRDANDSEPRQSRYPAVAAAVEVDATGAGDTFLAAMLVAAVRPAVLGRDPRTATTDVRFAAAAASLTVGTPGLDGIGDLATVLALVRTLATDPS